MTSITISMGHAIVRPTDFSRTSVCPSYGLFSPVSKATPPLCVVGYRWLCIQRLVRYRPIATRWNPLSRNSNPALDLVNSHSIVPFRNSYVILSKQFFNLFHAYARKNNMWILDQPLSPQLPDLLLDLRFMRTYYYASEVLKGLSDGSLWVYELD